jgi:N-acetylmuramoyl-L-alanine amidase
MKNIIFYILLTILFICMTYWNWMVLDTRNKVNDIIIPVTQDVAFKYTEEDIKCLTDNIYFEARHADATIDEWTAITKVVMNRIKIDRFPSTICEVVYDKYQFSWTKNAMSVTEYDRYMLANMFVKDFLRNYKPDSRANLTYDHYYAHAKVKPKWASASFKTAVIGRHTFLQLEK